MFVKRMCSMGTTTEENQFLRDRPLISIRFPSQGFAFISYQIREDAQKAIENLNGYGYDHLILKVEWAK